MGQTTIATQPGTVLHGPIAIQAHHAVPLPDGEADRAYYSITISTDNVFKEISRRVSVSVAGFNGLRSGDPATNDRFRDFDVEAHI